VFVNLRQQARFCRGESSRLANSWDILSSGLEVKPEGMRNGTGGVRCWWVSAGARSTII